MEADVQALDTDGELQRHMTELRRAVAGRIDGAGDVEPLRAALTATFEKVDLWSLDGKTFLVPYFQGNQCEMNGLR